MHEGSEYSDEVGRRKNITAGSLWVHRHDETEASFSPLRILVSTPRLSLKLYGGQHVFYTENTSTQEHKLGKGVGGERRSQRLGI